MPKFNSISISGYHMQEAGATADIELAYTFADGLEYLRAGVAKPVSTSMPLLRLVFLLGYRYESLYGDCQNACRTYVVGKTREQFNPKTKSLALRTHSQLQDGHWPNKIRFNNVGRTCIEAMAATGTHQSLHQCLGRKPLLFRQNFFCTYCT